METQGCYQPRHGEFIQLAKKKLTKLINRVVLKKAGSFLLQKCLATFNDGEVKWRNGLKDGDALTYRDRKGERGRDGEKKGGRRRGTLIIETI